jgi:hypothetical protein
MAEAKDVEFIIRMNDGVVVRGMRIIGAGEPLRRQLGTPAHGRSSSNGARVVIQCERCGSQWQWSAKRVRNGTALRRGGFRCYGCNAEPVIVDGGGG